MDEDPRCKTCGYDMGTILSERCPECGTNVHDASRAWERGRFSVKFLLILAGVPPVAGGFVVGVLRGNHVLARLGMTTAETYLAWAGAALLHGALLWWLCGIDSPVGKGERRAGVLAIAGLCHPLGLAFSM